MKKLILTFAIISSTIALAQTNNPSDTSKKENQIVTECYSTKDYPPLKCIQIKEEKESTESNPSLKKESAVQPKRKMNSKDEKK